jgi:molybdopterin synthase catalytic subunit
MPPQGLSVLLFAGLRARAGTDELELELELPTTVSALRRAIESAHPELGPLTHCRVAVDQAFADESANIDAGSEIALIPPVSGGADIHFGERSALSKTALSLDAVLEKVRHEGSGGICTFTGQVRRQSRGKLVEYLEYDAYPEMAVAQMDAIAISIEAAIEGSRVCIHHRYGRLEVGDDAVVIAASAPHRAEAFDACRRAIEELKQDVPIWKREVDSEGESWIGQGP